MIQPSIRSKTIAYELAGVGIDIGKVAKSPQGEGQVEYQECAHGWGTRLSQSIPKSGPEDVRGLGE